MCVVAPATTIKSDFIFISNDNKSTMTHYNHLEEARLEDGPIGYNARSLSYLVDGFIKFKDYTMYDDDLGENYDTLLYRDQTVEFHGEKSSSSFYAGGYYNSSRTLHAEKKICYIDLTSDRHNYSSLGDSYYSRDINVSARAGMGSTSPMGDYGFEYSANVTNGIIMYDDTTGWTNRSKDGAIDWEQEGEIKGNVSIVNNLRGLDLFGPCDVDWLPCI